MTKKTETKSGLTYGIKRRVSLPDFQFSDDEREYFVIFDGPIIQGRTHQKDADGTEQSAPFKARITDVETGEQFSALIPTMLRNRIEEAYLGDSYVSRAFRVVMHKAAKGKRYRGCDVDEIDLETGGETAA